MNEFPKLMSKRRKKKGERIIHQQKSRNCNTSTTRHNNIITARGGKILDFNHRPHNKRTILR